MRAACIKVMEHETAKAQATHRVDSPGRSTLTVAPISAEPTWPPKRQRGCASGDSGVAYNKTAVAPNEPIIHCHAYGGAPKPETAAA